MNLKEIVCPICGSYEVLEKNGKYVCRSCGVILQSNLVNKDFDKLSKLAIAESNILLTRFDDALELYEDLRREYRNWYAPYWGIVKAKYGIKYELDSSGKSIPSCYSDEYTNILEDKDFNRALELSDALTRKKLIDEANRISATWKEWIKTANKIDYDIFLCFKATDDETSKPTVDEREMNLLYDFLRNEGFKVFYSPVEMKKFVGAPYYDAYIFNAIKKSQIMIVYGSKPEYLTSTWVKNEWTRYLKQIEKDEKNIKSLLIICDGFNPQEINSKKLSNRQCFDGESKTLYFDLLKHINNIFNVLSGKKYLEHIKVNRVDQGTKKNINNSKIKLIDLKKIKLEKKDIEINSTFEEKEFQNSSVGIYTHTIKDRLKAGKECLKDDDFEDALNFFNDCIEEDNGNGQAWIGLLCAKLKNYNLLELFSNNKKEIFLKMNKNDFELLKKCNVELKNIIEFADSKQDGSRILDIYLNLFLKEIIKCFKNDPSLSDLIYIIFELINSYNTKFKIEARKLIAKNIEIIYLNKTLCSNLINLILSTLPKNSLDKYLEILENYIEFCIGKNDYEEAKKFNDLKLEHFDHDYEANIRNLYYSNGVNTYDEFLNIQNNDISIGKSVVTYSEHLVEIMQESNALKLIEFICKTEIDILQNLKTNNKISIDNAKKYFEFAIKYKFNDRNDFIKKNYKFLPKIVENNDLNFSKLIISSMPHLNTDDYLKYLAYTSTLFRKNNFFSNSLELAKEALTLQNNNFDALSNMMLSEMNVGNHSCNIKWKKMNKDYFESVIKYCPSIELQQAFINELIDTSLCYIDDCEDKKTKDFYYTFECFDLLLKYSNISDSNKYLLVDKISLKCLENKIFDKAKFYANLSLQNNSRDNYNARYVLLLEALQCANENEFVNCDKFNKNLTEYKNLILSCSSSSEKRSHFTKLANDNLKNIEKINQEIKEKTLISQNNKNIEEKRISDEKHYKNIQNMNRAITYLLVAVNFIFIIIFLFFTIKSVNHFTDVLGESFGKKNYVAKNPELDMVLAVFGIIISCGLTQLSNYCLIARKKKAYLNKWALIAAIAQIIHAGIVGIFCEIASIYTDYALMLLLPHVGLCFPLFISPILVDKMYK